MYMTPRLKQILAILLREEQSISVQSLADEIGVSKRTIQRELNYMESSLKDFDITFMSKTGVGVWLEGTDEEKKRLLAKIGQKDSYGAGNREERRKRLILQILKEKGLKKLYYYSSQFGVSEATISTDLEAVEKWLNQYQLKVIRRPGSGTAIEGSEENYRRAIRAFIDENIDTDMIREAYETEGEPDGQRQSSRTMLRQIFSDDLVDQVVDCIMELHSDRIADLTENAYLGLVIHIAIAINRILEHETIEPADGWMEQFQEDEDFRLAGELVEKLEKQFGIAIPEVEISYVCLHIKSAKHEKVQMGRFQPYEFQGRKLQQLVNDMIDAFDREKSYFLKQDDEFIQGLLAHLQPTLIRLTHNLRIQNPVLEDIRESYAEVYENCRKVADVLGKAVNRQVPEEEIGYLAVHFGAALVRLEGQQEELRQVQVGVICSSGIGISRLMSIKIKKLFGKRVELAAYGKNDITPFIIGKTDFFISSIPVDIKEIPVIYVNPLLNQEDIEKIRKLFYKYERLPKKQKKNEFLHELEEINQMAAQINTVIKYMEFFKVDNEITFEELLIAVGEKLSPYSDRSAMIREDLWRREQIATQVFAEFGFALLHTRTNGVIRPSFAVCMTKDLTEFRDPYFKGIQVVFVMLIPEDDNAGINREIFGYVSTLLIEEMDFLDTVRRGRKEEIRNSLSGYLKKFFSRYLAKF